MHKWKLFKKSAALVLSSAVIASGVPVTAMASEAEVFSDVSGETQGETAQEEGENEDQESVSQDQLEVGEADIQSEEPEESDAEAIQEEVAEISTEEIQQEEEPQIQEDTEEAFGDGEAFMAEAGEVLQDASEITVAGVKYLWSDAAGRGIYTDRNNRRLCKSGRRADSSERKAVRNDNLKLFGILCRGYHSGEL